MVKRRSTIRFRNGDLGARIADLQARQAALSGALSEAARQGHGAAGLAARYRTDAVVAVLEAAGTEMSIIDVMAALRKPGAPMRPMRTSESIWPIRRARPRDQGQARSLRASRL